MDENTPSDPNSETRSAIEALLPRAVEQLAEMVESGGTRTVRIRCTTCGTNNTHDVEVADADLLVKAVSALSSALPRMQAKDDVAGARVTKILHDLSELNSADLAQYILDLEALLDASDDG